MKKLTADYGYDTYSLDLSDEEAQTIIDKKDFTKLSEVWRETIDDDEESVVAATWKYDPKQDCITIEREDGAFFYSDKYYIE